MSTHKKKSKPKRNNNVKQHCHNAGVSLKKRTNITNGSWAGKRLGAKPCKSRKNKK